MSQQSALRRVLALIAATTLAMTLAMSAGCDVQSGDEVLRETQINIAGFYTNPEGDRIVSQNTGAKITSMNIMQTGNQLQGIDNNGIIFRGSIGSDSGSEASCCISMSRL